MTITWGNKLKPKDLSYVFGSGWEKGDFKFIDWYRTTLGWDFNLWRFSISYDNWGKVRSNDGSN